MTRPYREDIDWLRAVAVLSVLAFHWDVPPFRGGYVGVDIFFVISGFLITQIIQSEMAVGAFSFARFYERRVRRLLPALYVMVALVMLPSFYFLLPSERAEFFRSIVGVVTFTSNIFFWRETSYFARAADEKPLLHTWSLSVEEQFYLVLPLLVWALLKWRGAVGRNWFLFGGLGIAALASFALSHWLMTSGHVATAFFMSPPRAWEFLAGSLIAVKGVPFVRNVHLRRIAGGLGLALVLLPAFAYRDGTVFPGVAALLPCAGAAIFIWGGLGSTVVQRAAWSPLRVATFFGKISYSLYLWHWPLFIYAKFSKTSLTLDVFEKTALFGLAVALSYASYRYIEQPLRRGSLLPSRRAVFTVAGSVTAALLLVAVLGMTRERSSTAEGRAQQLELYGRSDYRPLYAKGSCFVESWSAFDEKACLSVSKNKTNILLWGDSLAAHYSTGLAQELDPGRINLLRATNAGCFPALRVLPGFNSTCRAFTVDIATWLEGHNPDLIIMSADWLGYSKRTDYDMIEKIKQTLSQLKSAGIPAIVIGPSVQFKSSLPSILLRANGREAASLAPENLVAPEIFALDRKMKSSILSQEGVLYVSVLDAVCPKARCPVLLANGIPLSWDHAHLTDEGSIFAVGSISSAIKPFLPRKSQY